MKFINPQEFKNKMLKIKTIEITDKMVEESIKMEAIRICSYFPELFGSELDRKTLWNRIGSAIETSIIKCNYDISYFVNSCLEHIKADHSKTACHEGILNFIKVNSKKSEEWLKSFFNYLSTRHFIIIAKARYEWEERKKLRKENK